MAYIRLQSKRMMMTDIETKSAREMFEYRSNREVSRFLTFRPNSLEEVVGFISKHNTDFDVEDRWFQVGLFRNDVLIGDVGVHFLGPNNAQCEVGYTIHPRFQRQGFGREAVVCVVDYLFQTLGKHRVIASVAPENVASIALLESIGFRKEGHFVKSIFLNGAWEDDVVYAILREEWGTDRPPTRPAA
jgi:RimJ/RimL family protein N-acetyltransferase